MKFLPNVQLKSFSVAFEVNCNWFGLTFPWQSDSTSRVRTRPTTSAPDGWQRPPRAPAMTRLAWRPRLPTPSISTKSGEYFTHLWEPSVQSDILFEPNRYSISTIADFLVFVALQKKHSDCTYLPALFRNTGLDHTWLSALFFNTGFYHYCYHIFIILFLYPVPGSRADTVASIKRCAGMTAAR